MVNCDTAYVMSPKPEDKEAASVTAVEYIETLDKLEKEARELMPFDPTECTYNMGELRQPVFACVTCGETNGEQIGVCYSCSIQCHSTHDIVELFSKRNFVCDCGTTKMSKTPNGACKLRIMKRDEPHTVEAPKTGYSNTLTSNKHVLELPAEDIPSLSNIYNQNFGGVFCSCLARYNPLEETGNMLQCYFGFACGEDWFHDECILGYKPGTIRQDREAHEKGSGKNILNSLPPPGEDATSEVKSKKDDLNKVYSVPHFPNLEDFDQFICWKCVSKFKHIFKEFGTDIIVKTMPHFDEIESVDEWKRRYNNLHSSEEGEVPKNKKIKIDPQYEVPYSIFLCINFRDKLKQLQESLPEDSKLSGFLRNHEYLYSDDPIFENPEDEGEESTVGSLYNLGTDALLSMPRDQAIEGLQAYEKISSKLKEFFKPFAEQGKVVTEDEVRDFFSDMKKEDKK